MHFIDASSAFGVVLHLDGEVAAHGFNENPIIDGNMICSLTQARAQWQRCAFDEFLRILRLCTRLLQARERDSA